MLKSKITGLCQLNNITVKKLSIETGFSEQSFYRWFKEDTMELKHLKIIANYFGKDLNYFFSASDEDEIKEAENRVMFRKRVDISLHEDSANYQTMKDKYISTLEENAILLKENAMLKEKLTRYEAELGDAKQNKAG
jgi:hypothetical protein